MEISKELLEKVLGRSCTKDVELDPDDLSIKIPFSHYQTQYDGDEINVYELVQKCKEWAYSIGYEIVSFAEHTSVHFHYSFALCQLTNTMPFDINAVFNASEWVLEHSLAHSIKINQGQ
jgi:hypothetical protein